MSSPPPRPTPTATRAAAAPPTAAECEFREGETFFVTGAGRSGTTACIRILGTASNAETFSEPTPRLTEEVRRHALGESIDPRPLIWAARVEAVRRVRDTAGVYGEKDLQVFAWLGHYRSLFNGRFILARRDGRDVVRSFMDFHQHVNGNMYREAPEDRPLSDAARRRQAALTDAARATEANRPRPVPGDAAHECWGSMSRLQMIAWYWAHTTRVAQRELYRMDDACWKEVDFSAPVRIETMRRLFDWLELQGFDADRVQGMLDERINAIEGKAAEPFERFPAWESWTASTHAEFEAIAGDAMVEMGYAPMERSSWRCTGRELDAATLPAGGVPAPLPDAVAETLGPLAAAGARILLVGDAPAVHGPHVIRVEPGAAVGSIPSGPFDHVVAAGVIDRVPEMDALLARLAERALGSLIVSTSEAASPDRIDHGYRSEAGGWRNAWSDARARSLLRRALGFARVETVEDPRRAIVVARRDA